MVTTPPPKPPSSPPPPLRDPAEGKSPAVGGGHLAKQGEHERVGPRPTIGVKGEPIEDGERDPDTIAEEQRRRSDEIASEGVEKWKAARDERSDEEKRGEGVKKVVAGAQAKVEGHKAP